MRLASPTLLLLASIAFPILACGETMAEMEWRQQVTQRLEMNWHLRHDSPERQPSSSSQLGDIYGPSPAPVGAPPPLTKEELERLRKIVEHNQEVDRHDLRLRAIQGENLLLRTRDPQSADCQNGRFEIGEAIKGGDTYAQGVLGYQLAFGTLMEHDYTRARACLEAAAAGGEPKFMHYLGDLCFVGLAGEPEPRTAMMWWRKAAEASDGFFGSPRMKKLPALPAGQNVDEAFLAEWCLALATDGDAQAALILADYYERGLGVAKDPRRALRMWAVAASHGDARAVGLARPHLAPVLDVLFAEDPIDWTTAEAVSAALAQNDSPAGCYRMGLLILSRVVPCDSWNDMGRDLLDRARMLKDPGASAFDPDSEHEPGQPLQLMAWLALREAKGDLASGVRFAEACESGAGHPRDQALAARCLARAALKDPSLVPRLAPYVKAVDGLFQGKAAVDWLKQAATAGSLPAVLALLPRFGSPELPDEPDETRWVTLAAELGDPGMQKVLLESYATSDPEKIFPGDGQDENRRRWIHEAAELGERDAMRRWAGYLSSGVDGVRDLAAAKKLLRRSADAGCEQAGMDLLYVERDLHDQDRIPVPAGDPEGIKTRCLALLDSDDEENRHAATDLLTSFHLAKHPIPLTLAEARRIEEMLKNGDPDSCTFHYLGDVYDQGDEKAMDREAATRCYLRAAESGSMVSDYALVAQRIFDGIGSHGTEAEALALLRSGVEAGDSSAEFKLGRLHETGEHGVPRDPAEARRLYGLAAALGCVEAADALKALPKD